MEFNNLLQLDINTLKNINWTKAREELWRRKDKLVVFVLIVVTLILCIYLFFGKSRENATLRTHVTSLEKKLKALEKLNSTKKDLEETKKKFPMEIPDDELISKIANLANAHGINISNFSPLSSDDRGMYTLTLVRLTGVVANDFKTMWAFLHDIENLSYAIRIESWSTNFSAYLNLYLQNPSAPKPPMSATLMIGAVHIK